MDTRYNTNLVKSTHLDGRSNIKSGQHFRFSKMSTYFEPRSISHSKYHSWISVYISKRVMLWRHQPINCKLLQEARKCIGDVLQTTRHRLQPYGPQISRPITKIPGSAPGLPHWDSLSREQFGGGCVTPTFLLLWDKLCFVLPATLPLFVDFS